MEGMKMSDKPGLPSADVEIAANLVRLVSALDTDTADGRAGVRAILREIEERAPGTLLQMAARLELRRMGLSAVSH